MGHGIVSESNIRPDLSTVNPSHLLSKSRHIAGQMHGSGKIIFASDPIFTFQLGQISLNSLNFFGGLHHYKFSNYCKFGHFCEGFIFAKLRSFVKTNPLKNGENTLSFTDIGTSCPSHEFLTWQICLLALLAKIKFSRKFLNLQYASAKFG